MAEIRSLGDGAYRIVDGMRSRIAYVAGPAEARWVFLDGQVYVIDAGQQSGQRRKRADDQTALAAPMPATVIAIAVEPGQRVSQGEVLIVLEAMKMELPIKAPREAVVRAVACRAGELVQPGVPLLELE